MKIKYLRNTHDSVAGDVKEVPDLQANVLIKIGAAEPASTLKTTPKTAKKD